MANRQANIAKTGAAAMARATKGRKTLFPSASEIRRKASISDFDEEIEEALESFRKNRQAGK